VSARRELDRVAAFSDGVFAIAITLLVLNIEVPDVPGADLGKAIRHLGDDFEAYAIGFAVMGLFWFGHHKLFARLARSNTRLTVVNITLLAFIALMPFTTAVLGRYDEPLAVTLFALNVGIAMILDGLTEAIPITDELFEEPPPAVRAGRTAGQVFGSAVARSMIFFVSIPIAYGVSESLAKWFWLTLLVEARIQGRRTRQAQA
jgi:uncharacterized membrane protein